MVIQSKVSKRPLFISLSMSMKYKPDECFTLISNDAELGLTYQNRKIKDNNDKQTLSLVLQHQMVILHLCFFSNFILLLGGRNKNLLSEQKSHASLNCRGKIWTMWKLTGLQIANFHRQLQWWDIIRSHYPLCTAAPPVLDTESRDRRAAVGSRDPGNINRTFCRHGDGGAIRSLGYWDRKK